MRKIKEVLRLKYALNHTEREIARTCSISRFSVSNYLKRAKAAGVTWPIGEETDDADLEAKLFSTSSVLPGNRAVPQPDFSQMHVELRRHKHLTLQLLWEEYKQDHQDGYGRSRFCELYRIWEKKLNPVMRFEHKAGDKMFVDYSGDTLPYIDPATGEERQAQIFVAVLGASSYTYAEATATQNLPNWIGAQERALHYFGGVTCAIVPDNTKTAVKHPCRYEPELNPTYQEFAVHYGTAVFPARIRKARDKAKVESGVLVVQRWILARLRNRTFIGLDEANAAIDGLLVDLNERRMRKLDKSRRELFEELDRPALMPLPAERFVFCEWKRARVSIDYHIEVQGCYYSVPYHMFRYEVEARITASTVEVYYKGKRLASHQRLFIKGRFSTHDEHRPTHHRQYLEWSPSRILNWAGETGPSTRELAEKILLSRKYPEQAYRSCLGLLRLGTRFGAARLEAACRRALSVGAHSYKNVKSILENGLDRLPLSNETSSEEQAPLIHENIRGPQYYQQQEDSYAYSTDLR